MSLVRPQLEYISTVLGPYQQGDIYTQTKVKQHHIFSETLFLKLQNGICGYLKSNILNFITFMST